MKLIEDQKYQQDYEAHCLQLPYTNFNLMVIFMFPTIFYGFGFFAWSTMAIFSGIMVTYVVFNWLNESRLKKLLNIERKRVGLLE